MISGRPPREVLAMPRFRVLLVDDDPVMLRVMEVMLSADMDVAKCTSGFEALRLLHGQTFDVVCSDYQMPRMNGNELLRAVEQAYPDVSCLLVTGASDYAADLDQKRHYVLLKPFAPERLLGLVAQLARIAQMKRSVKDSASRVSSVPERRSAFPPPPSSRPPGSFKSSIPPPSSGSSGTGAPSSAPPTSSQSFGSRRKGDGRS